MCLLSADSLLEMDEISYAKFFLRTILTPVWRMQTHSLIINAQLISFTSVFNLFFFVYSISLINKIL